MSQLAERAPARAGAIGGKYLSLTTYRQDGSPVATPVWFVEEGGRLFVITDAGSHKAKRLRRNPAVSVAACNARGDLRGEPVAGRAEFLPESERAHVDELMAHKYRVDRIVVLPVYRTVQRVLGHPVRGTGESAYLEIALVEEDSSG